MTARILILKIIGSQYVKPSSKNVLIQGTTQIQVRFVHHHKELEQPDGFERFIGWRRSNPHRANRNTHVNERKFARLRGRKRLLLELEDDVERRELESMTPDQLRMYLLRKGKPDMYKDNAAREWKEQQITYQTIGSVIDPYIAPEKSVLSRTFSSEGSSDVFSDIKDYWHGKWLDFRGFGVKRIRRKEGLQKFNKKDFAKEAEAIYISAYQALANRERQKLYGLMTEPAFLKLWPDVERGTLRWEFVRFNEPSVVVNVRVMDQPLYSGNDIAQVTVRFHSTQKMALFDKDGHLLVGSEEEPRELLEYIVFENHIASESGKWRYHAKAYPHWLKPKQPIVNRPALIEQYKEKKQIPMEPMKLRFGMSQQIKEKEKKHKEEAKDK